MDDYELGTKLGEGTFGSVHKAIHKKTGEIVAIKKINLGNAAEGINMTALREIKLLRELNSPHVIRLIDVFPHKRNLSLVFEYMVSDLEAVIKDRVIVLSAADVKAYMHAILSGLKDCHGSWLLHRDMKPNNCLISPAGQVKLADFGLARIFGSPDRRLTPQVFARWYRAPELLFGATAYGPGVDIWAAGCIFAELLLRRPWMPGDNDVDQLTRIVTALGVPNNDVWPGVEELPSYLEFKGPPPPSLRSQFPRASEDALSLLALMVSLNPACRPSAEACLAHAYFSNDPPPTSAARLPRPVVKQEPIPAAAAPAPPTVKAAARAEEPEAKRPRLVPTGIPASPGLAPDAAGKFSPRLTPPLKS